MNALAKFNEINKEIKGYHPFMSHVVWHTLLSTSSRQKYFKYNILNLGGAGCGKSWCTHDLVKDIIKPKHVVLVNKVITPRAFFNFILNHNKSILLFDEADLLMMHPRTRYMLKDLLFAGVLGWETHRESLLTSFSGSVIMNLNQFVFSTRNDLAIMDRVYYNQIIYTNEDLGKLVAHIKVFERNESLWKEIAGHVNSLYPVSPDQLSVSSGERLRVLDYVEETIKNKHSMLVSARCIKRSLELYFRLKKFFGKVNDDVWKLFNELADGVF